MEKKTVLALVLCFFVLFLWSSLFTPKNGQQPQNDKESEKEVIQNTAEVPDVEPPSHKVSTRLPEKIPSKTLPEADQTEIEIDTPLYRAVFSNAGPAIKSFKLKEYRQTIDPHSPLIELVNLEQDMGDYFIFSFDENNSANEEKLIYQVDHSSIFLENESSPKELTFTSITANGLLINQTYRFYPDKYNIDLTVNVINQSGKIIQGSFNTYLNALPPQKKISYYSFSGFVLLINDDLQEVKIKKASEEKTFKGQIGWAAYEDAYFISAFSQKKHSQSTFEGSLLPSGVLHGKHLTPQISINPSQQVSSEYTMYLGPRDLGILKDAGIDLDRAVNFGWTDILAKPLLYLLRFFNNFIHNYGVSIIILTIIVKILFWPLTHKSYKSMKEMQKLQPRMAKIREKYKDNKEQLNKEMMGLYKTYKVNPMGGCLPMIIQIPVFFALFRILGSAIELRHAPFMLWIQDLSAPDRLFNFPFHIPFMAPPYGVPVLTLLMGASMFIQQKMTPSPGDPAQAKIMMLLPLIFTFMFINFPSGLVLYWLVNNILSIGQQYRIHKGQA